MNQEVEDKIPIALARAQLWQIPFIPPEPHTGTHHRDVPADKVPVALQVGMRYYCGKAPNTP